MRTYHTHKGGVRWCSVQGLALALVAVLLPSAASATAGSPPMNALTETICDVVTWFRPGGFTLSTAIANAVIVGYMIRCLYTRVDLTGPLIIATGTVIMMQAESIAVAVFGLSDNPCAARANYGLSDLLYPLRNTICRIVAGMEDIDLVAAGFSFLVLVVMIMSLTGQLQLSMLLKVVAFSAMIAGGAAAVFVGEECPQTVINAPPPPP